jgi:hypothetical protein
VIWRPLSRQEVEIFRGLLYFIVNGLSYIPADYFTHLRLPSGSI